MALQIKCNKCGAHCAEDYVQPIRKPSGKTVGFFCPECWEKAESVLR